MSRREWRQFVRRLGVTEAEAATVWRPPAREHGWREIPASQIIVDQETGETFDIEEVAAVPLDPHSDRYDDSGLTWEERCMVAETAEHWDRVGDKAKVARARECLDRDRKGEAA